MVKCTKARQPLENGRKQIEVAVLRLWLSEPPQAAPDLSSPRKTGRKARPRQRRQGEGEA